MYEYIYKFIKQIFYIIYYVYIFNHTTHVHDTLDYKMIESDETQLIIYKIINL